MRKGENQDDFSRARILSHIPINKKYSCLIRWLSDMGLTTEVFADLLEYL